MYRLGSTLGRPTVRPIQTIACRSWLRPTNRFLYNKPSTVRPNAGGKSEIKGPAWYRKLRLKWREIDEDPIKRKRFAMAVIGFYIVTGYFAFQYLQDTKYKATGEASPYKRMESEDGTTEDGEVPEGVVKPHDTTEVYDQMAREYDSKIWIEELTSYVWYVRRKMMKRITGDVLEVSCGTGRNVKYFKPKAVNSIVFLDSSQPMLEITQEKFEKRFPDYKNVQYVKGRAEDLLTLASKSGQKFDTICETFGLCSHEDPVEALRNFRKLLKPDGRVILVEHGRSTYGSINERMDKAAERRAQEWGCRWNLDIADIVQQSGLEVVEESRYHFGTTYFYVLKEPCK